MWHRLREHQELSYGASADIVTGMVMVGSKLNLGRARVRRNSRSKAAATCWTVLDAVVDLRVMTPPSRPRHCAARHAKPSKPCKGWRCDVSVVPSGGRGLQLSCGADARAISSALRYRVTVLLSRAGGQNARASCSPVGARGFAFDRPGLWSDFPHRTEAPNPDLVQTATEILAAQPNADFPEWRRCQ